MSQDIVCPNCGEGHMNYKKQDVQISRKGIRGVVPDISGLFCSKCEEIDFDNTTDSAERYAAEGDRLLLLAREKAIQTGRLLKAARIKLDLTQNQASLLSGGGHNAFSRYETGTVQPIAAVVNLFQILEKHPELLKELDEKNSLSE